MSDQVSRVEGLLNRVICAQRGFSVRAVAREARIHRETVTRALEEGAASDEMADRIDTAITALTDRAGGLHTLTGLPLALGEAAGTYSDARSRLVIRDLMQGGSAGLGGERLA